MDRFLSKAKRVDNGEWVVGYYFKVNYTICEVGYYIMQDKSHDVAIDPSTLCQCTGLKDKNGVLIFEGD